MLSFCIGVYLAFVIPSMIVLWTSLVAAKEGDRKKGDDDQQSDPSPSMQDALKFSEIK